MLGRIVSLLVVMVGLCATAPDIAAQTKIPPVITLYIPSGIGGGYDTYGRLASRHLGRFLPGNPMLVPRIRCRARAASCSRTISTTWRRRTAASIRTGAGWHAA